MIILCSIEDLVVVAGNRKVGDCRLGWSMVEDSFLRAATVAMKACTEPWKRLANGANPENPENAWVVAHQMDNKDYRNHGKNAQNHICLWRRECPFGG